MAIGQGFHAKQSPTLRSPPTGLKLRSKERDDSIMSTVGVPTLKTSLAMEQVNSFFFFVSNHCHKTNCVSPFTQGSDSTENIYDWTVPKPRGTLDVLVGALEALRLTSWEPGTTRDRYKAIIDDTPDDYAVRMLRLLRDMAQPGKARCVSCSEFPIDLDSNKVERFLPKCDNKFSDDIILYSSSCHNVFFFVRVC